MLKVWQEMFVWLHGFQLELELTSAVCESSVVLQINLPQNLSEYFIASASVIVIWESMAFWL